MTLLIFHRRELAASFPIEHPGAVDRARLAEAILLEFSKRPGRLAAVVTNGNVAHVIATRS